MDQRKRKQTEKITKFLEEKKTAQLRKQKGACYICQDPGHYAPDCPTRRDPDYQGKKTTQDNACFECGHWVAQCPMKNIQDFEDLQDFQEPLKKKRSYKNKPNL